MSDRTRRAGQATAAISGIHEHPLREAPDYTALRFIGESARAAIDDAGLSPEDIDGLSTAGDNASAIHVAEYLGLHPTWVDATSIGGASFIAHVQHAADAISAGRARCVLVAYGSTGRSSRSSFGTRLPAQDLHDPAGVDDHLAYLHPYGVTLAAQYALVASQHMHRYGTTREQLANVAVSARAHATLNPLARYRDPITVDDVLDSRPIAEPLHLLDCCVITDGGGALVVTAPEVAADGPHPTVHVLGGADALGHADGGRRDLVDIAAATSGPLALQRAGVSHDDVDLCMIYDSFTISVLTVLEGLGFCAVGDGGAFVASDRLRLGGALPVNPDGGALSNHHPGRRGLFLAIEAVRQLRHTAGNRQVEGAQIALCHGVGGFLSGRHSGITLVLGGAA